VEIPVIVTSMDRRHAFCAQCTVLVVSPQGCGFRTPQALPIETPVLLNELPSGGNASGRVASCIPLGTDGKFFLMGVSLYNPGNVWGIANPPEDWDCLALKAGAATAGEASTANLATNSKKEWPYNLFSGHSEATLGRK
jgi:hypothetical protein